MIKHDIDQNVFEQLFKDHSVKVQVILRASKTKGANYDKFRDVGYEKTVQNPLWIKALTKVISSNSLILKELGLTKSGAIYAVIPQKDVSLIKLSEKMIVDGIIYTPRHKALGSRFQIEKMPFNYSKVTLFRINE
jgi:hypothetical protein